MFCPNCGYDNNDDATVCAHCGKEISFFKAHARNRMQDIGIETLSTTEVTDEQQSDDSFTKPSETIEAVNLTHKQKLSLAARLRIAAYCIAGLLLLCLGLYGYYAYNQSSPETTAVKYYLSFTQGKLDRAYSYLVLPSSKFTTKSEFDKFMSYMSSYQPGITGCTAVKTTTVDGNTKKVELKLSGKDNVKINNVTVTLKKQKEKNFLIFDKWLITPDTDLINNCEIGVTKNTIAYIYINNSNVDVSSLSELDKMQDLKFYIDDVSINQTPAADNNNPRNDLFCYTINYIFKGTHDLKISCPNPFFDAYTERMTLNSANPYTQFDWDFPLKKDNVLSITSNVYNFYNKLISAALNKDDFSTLSKYMTDDADKSDKIKEVYSELTADIGGDNNYYSYLYQQFKSNLDYEESPKTVSNNITYVNKDTYGVSTSFSDKDSYAGSFFGAKELAVLFKEQNGEQLVSDIYYTSV